MNTLREPYEKNLFFRDRYQSIMIAFSIAIVFTLIITAIIFYQITHRPRPYFYATDPNKQQIPLTSYDSPILSPNILLEWASKAAVAAYTFDFVSYNKQFALARPYFTEAGWADYQASVSKLIATITQNQLFVNGVVSGPPVISNQGDYPGRGFTWRVQLPFSVTYQSAESTSQKLYTVILTIIKVPTNQNPQGIGIDQFVMQ